MTQTQLHARLNKVADFVLRREGKGTGSGHVDISFVGPQEIRRLNRVYRKKNAVTDVLSFQENDGRVKFPAGTPIGEIVLCRSYIRTQARVYGVPYEEELVRMTIHGVLHILGHDHERPAQARRMLPLQEKYLRACLKSFR